MARVSVIIVNWNTKELLRECLKAVYASMDGYNLIVVDNGSTDGSVELVKDSFPELKLITNNENLGFGAANNQAVKVAKSEPSPCAQELGEYILFLNTDTVVNRHTIDRLIEFMDSNPRAGLCTPTLIRTDGTIQDTFGPYPSLATELVGRSLLKMVFPYRYTPRTFSKVRGPRRVDCIRGACMMARRSAIEEVEGFDERYFLFLEETDLCLRLNKKGHQIWWLPAVKVHHKGGGSADTQSASARIEYWRSRYIFFRKHCPVWKCSVLRLGLLVKLAIDWVLNLVGGIAKPFRKKLKTYSIIILWHILGCPGDWGLGSDNTVKIDPVRGKASNGVDNVLMRKGFESWWRKNRGGVLRDGDIIKDNATRSLIDYRGEVYVKRYKGRRFGKLPWLGEWRLISKLRQLGIPTVMPIAVGEGYLVTQRLRDVDNLHNFVLENIEKLTFQEKLNLTRSLAKFISRIHKKGLYHGDLHAGNILITTDCLTRLGGGEGDFYIIDLHRARLKMWLSKRKILRNLVQLNMFFSLQTSAALRLRFFKYYISGIHPPVSLREQSRGTPLSKDYKHYARMIEIRTRHACRKLWHKRDRLYLKKKKYGISGIYKGMNYIINPKYAHLDLGGILPYLKPGDLGMCLKNSNSSYVSLLELPDLGKVILKIHRQKRLVNYIKDIWRNSRAFRAWCGSWALLTRGIPTPEPILAIEQRHLRILRESLIVNRYIASTENLTMWLNKNWGDKTLAFKEDFIDKLAGYIRTIHNRGISPRDFKASNVLVRENANEIYPHTYDIGVGVEFYLIDLDHLERESRISLKKRLHNIVQLNKSCSVSATMRWRFLKGYFPKKDIDEQKQIARRVYRYIDKRNHRLHKIIF